MVPVDSFSQDFWGKPFVDLFPRGDCAERDQRRTPGSDGKRDRLRGKAWGRVLLDRVDFRGWARNKAFIACMFNTFLRREQYGAIKLVLYSFVGSALALVGIMAAFVVSGAESFALEHLIAFPYDEGFQRWAFPVTFLGFVILAGLWPFHTWAPTGHVAAPTGTSMLLAGVVMKLGAYGALRIPLTLFPMGAAMWREELALLAAVGIVAGALVALVQQDFKFIIGYSSVSHMGFVTLGIYAWNERALQGAVMTMLAHGLSAAALFMLAGGLQHRIHTRNMPDMGGFWPKVPKMTAVAIFFSVAALGMPGLGNFIGEFLALIGAFQANVTLTVVAAFGLILASVYSLWVLQKVFQGEYSNRSFDDSHLTDLSRREMLYFAAMMIGLVWMGLYPQTFLSMSEPVLTQMLSDSTQTLATSIEGGL